MKADGMPKIQEMFSKHCLELAAVDSEIRRVYTLGQEFKAKDPNNTIIDLSLGNPDLDPPSEVKQALLELINSSLQGTHRYTDNAGLLETRQYLAQELTKSEELSITPDSVFLTCGAASALQVIFRALLDKDDEVVVLAPYFCEYVPYSIHMGARPVIVQCTEQHQPDLGKIAEVLTLKTRAIIINSPNNPSGVVYSKKILGEICALLVQHRLKTGRIVHIISDEPYNRLVYSGIALTSIANLYDFVWTIRSHSKDLGLAGERIGYFFWGPSTSSPEVLKVIRNAARVVGSVNAPALMQRILPKVYHSSVAVNIYEQRVTAFVNILREGGFDVVMPSASFFVFPRSPIADDKEFCNLLITEGVLCVPGSGFGTPGYFRASVTQSLDAVIEAAKRIVSCFNRYKNHMSNS